MSWLTDLANKAENFLNTLDNSAAEVFKSNEQQQFFEDHHTCVDVDSRHYIIDTPYSSNQPNQSHSRYDLPVIVKPLEIIAPTNFHHQESLSESNKYISQPMESNAVRTTPTTTGSISATRSGLMNNNVHSELSSNVQSKISRNKDFKSTIKSNYSMEKSADLDLFNFLNTNKSNSSDDINRLKHEEIQQGTVLSTNNKIDEDQSSGYETYLSTIHSELPVKINENEESFTETTKTSPQSETVHDLGVSSGDSSKQSLNTHSSSIISDFRLENKLLRSEVSSLSQEVSGLLRRNHKSSEEIKQLTGQIDRLNNQLKDSDQRVRELQIKLKESDLCKTSDNSVELLEAKLKQTEGELSAVQNNLSYLQSQLEKNKLTISTLECNLQECRQHKLIADKKVELAQNDNIRLTRELTQYKEKANHILAMKERVILSLRGQNMNSEQSETNVYGNDDSSENELIASVRAECDLLREEAARWRLEVEHREMSMQELELQMQAEKDSLRRNIELSEQQAERERQLREEADTELAHSRQSLRDLEETFSRQKADLHNKLMSTEAELVRLRQLASNEPARNYPPSRTDQVNIITLESRIRQLTDNLLSKQDALDSVLAQNHALKIRLDRVLNDNETLISALPNNDAELILENGRSYRSSGTYGCTRLNLQDTPIPKHFRPIAHRIDNIGIRIANTLRRFPNTRLIVMIYLFLLHLSIIIAFFMTSNNDHSIHRNNIGSDNAGNSKLSIESPSVAKNPLPSLVLNKP
ncbi:Golgin subfamily A member 5 [Schistosoma japonicum]|nr:Golgin subfamily A member 5 [Schistosoma japonicum]